jgi:hypothetical protein
VVEDRKRRRRDSAWLDAAVIVSTIAAGTVVAGLLNDPGTGEPAAAREYSYTTEPAQYPTRIPGCAAVEPPSDPERANFADVGSQEYDNPRYPWFSGAKAAAMTQAVVSALPDSVDLVFASPRESLEFEPIADYDSPPSPGRVMQTCSADRPPPAAR